MKKIIINVSCFILIFVIFYCVSSFSSQKIIKSETIREEEDIQTLNEIKMVFDKVLEQEEVQEYILDLIKTSERAEFWISEGKIISFDGLEKMYSSLYGKLDTKVADKIFVSNVCRNFKANQRICVYIDKDLKVLVENIDSNGEVAQCRYLNKKMMSYD